VRDVGAPGERDVAEPTPAAGGAREEEVVPEHPEEDGPGNDHDGLLADSQVPHRYQPSGAVDSRRSTSSRWCVPSWTAFLAIQTSVRSRVVG